MEIKEMQSLLLTKGLRVTEDDPLFAVVTLTEIAINQANATHLEQLKFAFETLQKFQIEMRSMGDAILSAAEILTIGRQFLSGENEQILEDVQAIKGSIETIVQRSSVSTSPNEDRLNKAIESMNASLSHMAKSINGPRSILHLQNETFLMNRVKEITDAVHQIKDIEQLLQSAARERIDSSVAPLVQQMSEQVKKLSEKDTFAMRFMQKTNETQEKMAANIGAICVGVGSLVVLAFAAGFLLRPALAG